MWSTSDAFRELIVSDHRAVVQVEVWPFNGAGPLATLTGDGSVVVDGSVTADQRSLIRRRCSLTIVDETGEWTPADYQDLLSPFGRELRIWRGVRHLDGTDELVPLGVFRLATPVITDGGAGVTITLEGKDRAGRVAAARWAAPFVVGGSGVTVAETIRRILLNRMPGCPIGWDDDTDGLDDVVPRTVLEHGASSDPWRDATRIARDKGLDLYFDPEGVARLVPVPTPTDVPVVVYEPGGVITSISRTIDTDNTYSGVIVTGESTGKELPVYGAAWDTNPQSPTYEASFGRVPKFITSHMVTTVAQARRAARANLQRLIAAAEPITWTQVPDPALEPFDLVEVSWPALQMFERRLVVDSIVTPLSVSGAQAVTARPAFAVDSEGIE